MKIAYFTPNYPGVTGDGGIGTYTRDLAQTLSQWGHEVHVVTPAAGRATVNDGLVQVHLVATRHLPVVDRLIPGAGACFSVHTAMTEIVRAHQIDVVEFPNWEGFGSVFSMWRSVPLVARLSTSSKETQAIDNVLPSARARWDVRREKWLALHADVLVTHSDAHRRHMAKELGIAAAQIEVAPLGIPVFPDFVRKPRPAGDPTVLYLGRMEKRKGTIDLLQAIPQVLQEFPKARFVFIGSDRAHCPEGVTHAEYIGRTFSESVRAQIQLLGRLPDDEVKRWMQTADVFVAPSLYESFGLIFVEAMRWQTPVVGTRAGGIPEIIGDDETGIIVPPESPPALAAALVGLLQNEPRRLALGRAGRARVESHFSLEKMAERAEALYARTIAARRGGFVTPDARNQAAIAASSG